MAAFIYLWNKRAKFPLFSKLFVRAWSKRILSFGELYNRNRRRKKLTRQGATISETAEVGNVIVDGNKHKLTIGSFTFLGQVHVSLHETVVIGERVCINDGVRILTGSHDVFDSSWKHIKKKIIIDDYVWIGMNAIILPGVSIGRGAVIGAGAVVTKSVAPGNIVVGNPARALNKARVQNLDYNPCEFLAANRSWLVG